jgi:hypothetical protein
MNISQEKEKIQEIIRRSSLRNYFTPLVPKQHKPRRPDLPKKLAKMTVDLEKLTLKLLIPTKSLTQEPINQHHKSKTRKFIQLSSKLLNFQESESKSPSINSLQMSLEVKNMNQIVSYRQDYSNQSIIGSNSIIYENRKVPRRHTFSESKDKKSSRFKKAPHRCNQISLNMQETPYEDVELEAWSYD